MGIAKKIRILVLLRYLSTQGGLQGVVNNYYGRLNREEFDVDYLVLDHDDCDFEKTILSTGSRIYYVAGVREKDPILLIKEAKSFFNIHNDYDILHCHQTNFDFVFLYYAHRSNIPIRIIHSHSTHSDIPSFQLALERFGSRKFATHKMACSFDAGKFLFGNAVSDSSSFFLINNAFDLEKYKYSESFREQLRKQYGISKDSIVVGQIGRLAPEKMHDLSLKVVSELKSRGYNIVFVIAGEGGQRSAIESMIQDLGLSADSRLTGSIDTVSQLLSALDVFLMPSRFEGVPVALLEAFANGCPAVIADVVNPVINRDDGIYQVSLDAGIEEWADRIIDAVNRGRTNQLPFLKAAGYDIESQASYLRDIYCRLIDSLSE